MACQAREDTNQDGSVSVQFDFHGGSGPRGDALRPYLFLEPGPGIAIDELLAWDRSGRHVVFVREGTLRLLDSLSGQEQVLSPGPFAASLSPYPRPRARFSGDGSRLIYLRPEEGKTVAVLRDMARGTERVVDMGEGQIDAIALDDAGRWAAVQVVTEDTDKDGRLSGPEFETNLAPALCRGPVMSSSLSGEKGDRPTYRMRHLDTGRLVEGSDSIIAYYTVGDQMLRQMPDGAIVAEDAHGKREEWVPASCNGVLFRVDAPRRQVLVACRAQSEHAPLPLELHGPALHKSLGWSVSSADDAMRAINSKGPLLMVSAQRKGQRMQDVIVDLERRAVVPVPLEKYIVETGRDYVLLLERKFPTNGTVSDPINHLWLWNVITGEQRHVGMENTYGFARVDDLVLHMGWVVDLGTGTVLGKVTEASFELDARGRVLVPVRPEPKKPGIPVHMGPVRWAPATQPASTNIPASSAPSP
ncbi:hypothetical protein [Corallococcus macrosporus]|uniref:Uncharacterized protein n=1 Tax=Myxococcus fulvus (strain ATCC BAA-855 / HW-1) TaxID=483219 RepID=F8CGG2_MYXFH|nr:hypothetical protein [Corallococcus macrosporus]AEI68697.1 hypothetical protein LILAB_34080 [Corallococcus macrosporus]